MKKSKIPHISSSSNTELLVFFHRMLMMNTSDWRWAAHKGFWDPQRRCWIEGMGGMEAYLAQKQRRCVERLSRKRRKFGSSTDILWGTSLDREGFPNTIPRLNGTISIKKFSLKDQKLDLEKIQSNKQFIATSTFLQNLGSSRENRLHSFMAKANLGHKILQRYWTFGYDPDDVILLFHQLPRSLKSEIRNLVETLQYATDCKLNNETSLSPTSLHQLDGDEHVDIWEKDSNHGFIRILFSSSTQEQVAFYANPRAASFFGLNRGELLSKVECKSLPLNMCPLDALRHFLHSLETVSDADTTKYYRIKMNGENKAALVCARTVKSFDNAGKLLKVKRILRFIDAEEYDASVRLHRHASPLAATGDERNGRQLLEESAKDASQTIQSLLQSKEGRATLNEITNFVRGLCLQTRRRTQAALASRYPCPSALKPFGVLEATGHSKPLQYPAASHNNRDRKRSLQGSDDCGAAFGDATATGRRLSSLAWSFFPGSEAGGWAKMAEAMPSSLSNVFEGLLRLVAPGFNLWDESPVLCMTAPYDGINDQQLRTMREEVDQQECDEWEMNGGRGFLRVDFEGADQNPRRKLRANSALARLLYEGMTHEEVLEAAEGGALALPFPELDALRILLFQLGSWRKERQCIYARAVPPAHQSTSTPKESEAPSPGTSTAPSPATPPSPAEPEENGGEGGGSSVCRALLFRRDTLRRFDALGRVVTVKHVYQRVSPEEYDEALRRDPCSCPLALAGDARRGQQLLDEAPADARSTLRALIATEAGRSHLEGLARFAEAVARALN